MTVTLPPLTLVLGGAASGKSDYAERLVATTGRPLVYIATAQSYDAEMSAKIEHHQTRRGPQWRTVEAPLDPAPALGQADPTQVILLDCATMWLSNHLLAGTKLPDAEGQLLRALTNCPAPVVIVSNEVGAGIVPENALARKFRQAQGELNQRLARQSDLVITVMAGLPLCLKGSLPKGAP
ncbi:bifunctional adenosylcobinamide kinase/adenosylcobinamide-phosphate guanylyltransferase [Aliiroseovarius sediminis]|uniref:bifunctional adenosylcobinamide kinase/adenosylcobinamide-phosphate guanylyltransferase n=1 Tax=Aliiroseovarius sediminis TaxID=2925839 RepID=UPI001F59E102|nr:bifunctional adenosylcobinamide kinase/adenosylcobinamide-phosphate guanylyltransferase [Aliiroseovarius sediminis]MCI2394267.1 bifunctional adenosylcobinamide kinase/adenosylcobinamide-phosphate guanylyltransferase [Aliiroseovarius sediminis]